MQTIDNIQQLINDRAESRLDVDLASISSIIKNNRLLRVTDNPGMNIERCVLIGDIKSNVLYVYTGLI